MVIVREYRAEWIDAAEQERRFQEAVREASARAVALGNPPIDPEVERVAGGTLDWAAPEDCGKFRRFPSLALAKAWAASNRALDLWEAPQVVVTEHENGKRWNWETVETWSLEADYWERKEA